MTRLLMLALVLLSLCGRAGAQGVLEDELFASEALPTQAAAAPAAEEERKSLGVSGDVLSVAEDVFYSSRPAGAFSSYIVGNFLLDARLKRGVKAFANVETTYRPQARETATELREAFVDFNLGRRVYFRTGKQVLQWGRCALWNPTDLVNAERQTALARRIGYRDGAYGLKFHAPFGTRYNLYGFVDTGSAREDRDLAGALKFEFLAGRTEMAFSGWGGRDRHPVFGYDVSTRLGRYDLAAEASASPRDNGTYVRESGGTLYTYRKTERWPLKAALNLRRGFRVGNFNDRLTVAAEGFYNRSGYRRSPFRDKAVYAFSGPAALLAPAGTRGAYLLANGLYQPNYTGRHYAALFATLTRFVAQDLTLGANLVNNLDDGTGLVSSVLSYRDINDFTAALQVNAFSGGAGGEYTFAGARLAVQLMAGLSF